MGGGGVSGTQLTGAAGAVGAGVTAIGSGMEAPPDVEATGAEGDATLEPCEMPNPVSSACVRFGVCCIL